MDLAFFLEKATKHLFVNFTCCTSMVYIPSAQPGTVKSLQTQNIMFLLSTTLQWNLFLSVDYRMRFPFTDYREFLVSFKNAYLVLFIKKLYKKKKKKPPCCSSFKVLTLCQYEINSYCQRFASWRYKKSNFTRYSRSLYSGSSFNSSPSI